MRVAARWMASSFERRSGSGRDALESRRLHQDRGERIPQVVGDDAEHLIAELRCLDRGAIETCILDGHGGAVRQGFGPAKIALPVNAMLVRGSEQQHPEGSPMQQQRHRR